MPTIYISKNYKVDYIKNGINGFAVDNLNEMINKISGLVMNQDLLNKMRVEAYKLTDSYSWDNLIKDYNKYFYDSYVQHSKTLKNSTPS